MKTVDRYIALIFLKNLGISFLSMVALFWFQSIFADLFSHQNSIGQILTYHAMGMPQVVAQMAPAAVLLSTVLTLSGISRSQELVACYTIGIGLNRIIGLIMIIICL